MARRLAGGVELEKVRCRAGFPEGPGGGGSPAGHGTGRGGAQRRRVGGGSTAWHGRARGDHASPHADIGIEMVLSTQGSKKKTDRVTLRQISNSTKS